MVQSKPRTENRWAHPNAVKKSIKTHRWIGFEHSMVEINVVDQMGFESGL